MKLICECGMIIIDQTDYLPYKAHFIPDQEWFDVFDAIDRVIEEVAAGTMMPHHAQTAARRAQLVASRQMWQCNRCGRLLVADRQQTVNFFAPASGESSKEILRSRDDASS